MKNLESLYYRVKERYFAEYPSLKRGFERSGIFEFLFKEKKEILKWNRSIGIIKTSFFGLKISLTSPWKQKLNEMYLRNILLIKPVLDEITKNGWRYQVLSIKEYNLIVLFADFCTKFKKVESTKGLSYKDFSLLEESFLKLTWHSSYPDIIMDGLKKILKVHKNTHFSTQKEIDAAIELLVRFFQSNYYFPSFYELLLAYNIVRYRRYLEWPDLKYPYKTDIVQDGFYDCSFEIFEQIVTTLTILEKETASLKEEEAEYLWIKKECTVDADTGPSRIIDYYTMLGYDWYKDKDDLFLLLMLFLKGIIDDLYKVINKEWRVMTDDEEIISIRIVRNDEVEQSYNNIVREYNLARGRHQTILPPQIPLARLVTAQEPDEVLIESNQRYIFQRIDTILYELRQIGMVFKRFYPFDEKRTELDYHLRFMFVQKGLWKGKPVFSIFQHYTELFLQSAGFFKEKKLQSELRNLHKIARKIKANNEKLRSLHDSDSFIEEMIRNELSKRVRK